MAHNGDFKMPRLKKLKPCIFRKKLPYKPDLKKLKLNEIQRFDWNNLDTVKQIGKGGFGKVDLVKNERGK